MPVDMLTVGMLAVTIARITRLPQLPLIAQPSQRRLVRLERCPDEVLDVIVRVSVGEQGGAKIEPHADARPRELNCFGEIVAAHEWPAVHHDRAELLNRKERRDELRAV